MLPWKRENKQKVESVARGISVFQFCLEDHFPKGVDMNSRTGYKALHWFKITEDLHDGSGSPAGTIFE